MKSKLLIIIPAYNEEENIERVVSQIIHDYDQYDYLVVNDEQDVYYYVTSSFSHSEDINEDYFAYHVELDTIEDLTKSQYQEIYGEYLNNELTGYAGTLLS